MGLWVCGFVILCNCVFVGLWDCGFVTLWICGSMFLWACGFMPLWVCVFMCLWVCVFVGLCSHALNELSSAVLSIQGKQGSWVFSICTVPDRGLEQAFRSNLCKGGEIEKAISFCPACLGEHVCQPAFTGSNH